jgi:hypothetical protein
VATINDTSAAISTGQVAVTSAAAVQIRPALAGRTKLTLFSSVPIFIADTGVGAATGYPPFGTNAGGGNYDIPTQDAVFAQAVGGAGTVFYMEFHTP